MASVRKLILANVDFFSLADEGVSADPNIREEAPQIFATAFGQSKEDAQVVSHQLFLRLLSHINSYADVRISHIHVREGVQCAELMAVYRKSI